MLTPDEALRLARIYCDAKVMALATLGGVAINNNKVFGRIAHGKGVSSLTLEKLERWFLANWPADAKWPRDIGRRRKPATDRPIPIAETCAKD